MKYLTGYIYLAAVVAIIIGAVLAEFHIFYLSAAFAVVGIITLCLSPMLADYIRD